MKKKIFGIFFSFLWVVLLFSSPSMAFEELKLDPKPTPILGGRFQLNLPQGLNKNYQGNSSFYELLDWKKGPYQITLSFEEKFVRLKPKEKTEEILLKQANRNSVQKKYAIKKIKDNQNWRVYLLSETPDPKISRGTAFRAEIVDPQQINLAAYAIIQSDSPENFKKLAKVVEDSLKTLKPGHPLPLEPRKEVIDLVFSGEKISVQLPQDYYLAKALGAKKGKEEFLIASIQELGLKDRPKNPEKTLRLIAHKRGHPGWDLSYRSKKVTKKLFGKDQVWWVSQDPKEYYLQAQYPSEVKMDQGLPYFFLLLKASDPKGLQELEKIVGTMELYEN